MPGSPKKRAPFSARIPATSGMTMKIPRLSFPHVRTSTLRTFFYEPQTTTAKSMTTRTTSSSPSRRHSQTTASDWISGLWSLHNATKND